jgi:quinoprotein glucose dehydrogenase
LIPTNILLKEDSQDTLKCIKDLVKRTNAPSRMPEMKFILSKKEIRDVVSFLATLKENN